MTFSDVSARKHYVFRVSGNNTSRGVFGKLQVLPRRKSKTSGNFCLLRFYEMFSAFSHRKRWFSTVVFRILEVLHVFSSVSETGESQHFPENVGAGKRGCAVKRRENVGFLHVFRHVLLK